MHQEIAWVSNLSGLIFSKFVEHILYNSIEIEDPRIEYYPYRFGSTGWVISFTFFARGSEKVLRFNQKFTERDINLLQGDRETLANIFMQRLVSTFPTLQRSTTPTQTEV